MIETQQPIRVALILGASDAYVLEAEIDALAARLAAAYPALPAEAQASAILLGHSLGDLRRKLELVQLKATAKRKFIVPENVRRAAA